MGYSLNDMNDVYAQNAKSQAQQSVVGNSSGGFQNPFQMQNSGHTQMGMNNGHGSSQGGNFGGGFLGFEGQSGNNGQMGTRRRIFDDDRDLQRDRAKRAEMQRLSGIVNREHQNIGGGGGNTGFVFGEQNGQNGGGWARAGSGGTNNQNPFAEFDQGFGGQSTDFNVNNGQNQAFGSNNFNIPAVGDPNQPHKDMEIQKFPLTGSTDLLGIGDSNQNQQPPAIGNNINPFGNPVPQNAQSDPFASQPLQNVAPAQNDPFAEFETQPQQAQITPPFKDQNQPPSWGFDQTPVQNTQPQKPSAPNAKNPFSEFETPSNMQQPPNIAQNNQQTFFEKSTFENPNMATSTNIAQSIEQPQNDFLNLGI